MWWKSSYFSSNCIHWALSFWYLLEGLVYLSPIGPWFLTCQACGHVGLAQVDKAWDRKLRWNDQISRLLAHNMWRCSHQVQEIDIWCLRVWFGGNDLHVSYTILNITNFYQIMMMSSCRRGKARHVAHIGPLWGESHHQLIPLLKGQ